MSAPDRIAELRHQRALIEEHLAWLNREIAAAETKPTNPNAATPRVSATSPEAPEEPASTLGSSKESISDQYQLNPADVERSVRKGCLLYFIGAILLLSTGVVTLYLLFRH